MKHPLKEGQTQKPLTMHVATWHPICCKGLLLPLELTGLILKELFSLKKKIHPVDRLESFNLLWSRLADPGTYIQGCLSKCRAV